MNQITNPNEIVLTDHAIGVFSTHDQAGAAVRALNEGGFNIRHLSIIGQNYHSEEQPVGFVNVGDRMWAWGKLGAFWGGIWGLLFGSAMILIPGVGPILLGGWIVATLQGALMVGGIAALAGALVSLGIPKNSVVEYESALKAGSFLVIVHGTTSEILHAKSILSTLAPSRVDVYSSIVQPENKQIDKQF